MFSIDPTLTYLDVDSAQVIAISESINQPHVAVPERVAQPALGFIACTRDRRGEPSLFVYLWLARSREPVIYVFEERERLAADLRSGIELAVEFCESMGFMMEEISLEGLDEEARSELVASLAPFQAEPELRNLERSPGIAPALGGPSMNANYEVGRTTDPMLEPLDLEPIEDEPGLTQEETETLAKLLVSF